MAGSLFQLVGRVDELAALGSAIDEARDGRGGVWLLTGEPGIGKSRLVEEAVRARADDAIRVVWGRCWEAGGAPAFWPWIQVLRALVAGRETDIPLPAATTAHLTQLLPELAAGLGDVPEPPPLDVDQARFQLLDAAARLLGALAVEQPTVIVLEDLHAGDPSSVMLLEFLAHQVRGAPLLVIGTYRESGLARAVGGRPFEALARHARTLALTRLSREHVVQLVEEAVGRSSDIVVDSVYRKTEGHPLFTLEVIRLLASPGGGADEHGSVIVPRSVKTAIRERLALLAPGTREVLECAAVVGREFRVSTVAASCGCGAEALQAAFDDALDAAVLEPAGTDRYRFSHMLMREVLHDALDGARRAELHHAVAEALSEARDAGRDVPWSAIAHHFLAAGDESRDRAVEACERAAERALGQSAFEDAVEAYAAALATLEGAEPRDAAAESRVRLALAHAKIRSGDAAEGQRDCVQVAAAARTLGDAELLTRAALEYGSVYVYARVDSQLVSLLREALDALGPADSGLRARGMARLASAQQPALDPSRPIALAREAIDMARRVGDSEVLLDVLRAGCSSMVDLADPSDRVGLNREHLQLARSLGRDLDAYRAATRLAVDHFELGDLDASSAAIAEVARIADRSGHPFYRWRAVAFEATRALWEGRLDEAEERIEESMELAAAGRDPNARATEVFQRARLYRLAGRQDELAEVVQGFGPLFGGTPIGDGFARIMMVRNRLDADRDRALADLRPEHLDNALAELDRTSLEALAEIAHASGDADVARRIGSRFGRVEGRFVTTGVMGITWEGPLARGAALVAATLGEHEQAERWFEVARDQAQGAGGVPVFAWSTLELAEHLATRRDESSRSRARSLAEDARGAAERLGMAGLVRRAERLLGAGDAPAAPPGEAPTAGVPAVGFFRMEREGDVWRLACDERTIRLKDTKGLQLLATLVAAPGREFHALDLLQTATGDAPIDTGDAGELLDAQARDAYRARVEELRGELEEAERFNDGGCAERAREELDQIAGELARGVGLGGRERRAGSAAERARVNVRKRLKAAIVRITEEHPGLGAHLEWAVKTGTFCSYSP